MMKTATFDGEQIEMWQVVSFARQNEADTLIEKGLTREKIGWNEFENRVHQGVVNNAASYADEYKVTVEDWLEAVNR